MDEPHDHDDENCAFCRSLCDQGCEDEDHSMFEQYDRAMKHFYGGVTYVEQFSDYDLVGFDTAHVRQDLHVEMGTEPPSELVRNTLASISNDPLDLRTVKTKVFVEDCLNLTSRHLAQIQNDYETGAIRSSRLSQD
jgi:hypothetical protein